MSERPSWEQYFGQLARQVSTRSTCPRKQVGAVIIKDKNILSTGYNGSLKGSPHCSEVGCMIENGHCIRTVHAEANAIVQAAKHGVKIEGASIYVTASPCFNCFKLIANSGIKEIYYLEFYRDDRILKFAEEVGIKLIDLNEVE
ncbi:MAG: deaminase [Methanobacteriota archaeon]|nr:MAG: deaminase [Euryarchaeota archaeon]